MKLPDGTELIVPGHISVMRMPVKGSPETHRVSGFVGGLLKTAVTDSATPVSDQIRKHVAAIAAEHAAWQAEHAPAVDLQTIADPESAAEEPV